MLYNIVPVIDASPLGLGLWNCVKRFSAQLLVLLLVLITLLALSLLLCNAFVTDILNNCWLLVTHTSDSSGPINNVYLNIPSYEID